MSVILLICFLSVSSIFIVYLKNSAHMICFKKHFFVCKDDPDCSHCNDNGLYTLCLGRHSDFFLREIYDDMKKDARHHTPVILYVHPRRNKSQRDYTDKEIYCIAGTKLQKSSLIRPFDEKQWDMPGRPNETKQDRFPKPASVLGDGVFPIPSPPQFLYNRGKQYREKG